MAKEKEKLEVFTSMVVKFPESFNLEIEQYRLNLRKNGIRKTKMDLFVTFARIGYLSEIQKNYE